MSVNKQDIDLKKALEASAGKVADKPTKNASVPSDLSSALLQSTNDVKKKVPSPEPSKEPLDGAAPGTTNTTNTIKWEDNPLNPVKAVNDYEAKRDKTPEILFKDEDKSKLGALITKYGVAPASSVFTNPLVSSPTPSDTYTTPVFKQQAKVSTEIDYESAANVVNAIKTKLDNLKVVRQGQRGMKKSSSEEELEKDLVEAQKLKRKAFNEMVVNGDKQVEVLSRQDDSGNSFKRTMQDIFGSKPGGWQTDKPKIEDKLAKLPTQFLTGMNILKGTEPAEYERLTDNIASGLPISQSQIAKITNLGINLEEAKLQRDILKSPVTKQERETVETVRTGLNNIKTDLDKYEGMIKAKQPLSSVQIQDYEDKIKQYNATVTKYKPLIEKINTVDEAFAKKATSLMESRKKNLIDNPEVLRAFIADGVAAKLDELGKVGQKGKDIVSSFMLGHTWNYSPEQIKWASEQYLKEQGIDPTIPQVKSAIEFLQENEGVMIGENSIAKAGGFRELSMGLIEPIEGISKFLDDKTRPLNDVYAESQSQGNVQAARKRLESEDTGVRGVVNDVLKGTGQFATQAAIMYGTSGLVGTLAEGIMGKAGVELLANAKAANIKTVIPFDDATAHIATGKLLSKIKDPLSVFTTSYAMSYDGNLKAALSYTSDNALAKRAASFNASMEGATELFLSPLDIARGIIHKFSKNQTKDLLKILSDKSLKDDPSALKEYVGKFARGVLGTAKVSGAEMGEEMVTQISDYVTNMYLNPESDSFKNRNLRQELMTTAYQTGLSMALPALLNGIGAARANSFSKGSLMVAAQNRQAMVDDLNKSVATGAISQDYATQQIQLINTAAEINAKLPKKANGADLNTDEKANYIWSRTTEAYMDKKVSSTTDAAEKEIWKDKILKQQEYRKGILGLKEEVPEAPEYTIEGKPVSREEFLKAIEEKPDGNYVVTGDEEAQAALRKIGGVDDKTDSEVESAVITIGGKTYEGKNHAEAILKAKAEGQDISKVDRKKEGKFKLADGTIIDRAEAKKRFGQDRSELLIEQDEAADNANKEYRKTDKDLVNEVQDKNIPGYEETSITELKEQALGAPASLKNQFDDEELVVNLIANNSEEKIQNAINWQTERLDDANLSDVELKEVDKHIRLLEQGLEKNKQFAEVEDDATGYNSKIETVNVDDLEFTELDEGKIEASKEKDVEKYAEKFKKGETPGPILVGINAEGKRVVIDGHRRVLAAKKAGVKTLKAVVRDRVTENDKSINYPEIQLLEAEAKAAEKPKSKLEQLKEKRGIKPKEVTTTPTEVKGKDEASTGLSRGDETVLNEDANKILGLHDNGVNFDLFDNAKLRQIAKDNGIDLPEGTKNADIIKALKDKQKELTNRKVDNTAKSLEDLSEKEFDSLSSAEKVALYKEHGITKEDGSPITEKDIENNPLQYSYDFMAHSDSGKWNSANSELESAVQGNRKQFSLYKLMLGEFDTFKEFVDFINSKNYGDKIEYTKRMRSADETMTPEERKSAIDSYNKSAEGKADDKAQKEKDILNEHGLEDETEYTPHELIEKHPLKGVQKIIWDIIKPIVAKLGIKVKFSSGGITEGFDGSNNPMNGEILIRPSTLKNGRFGEVLVHEVVHSLTTKIISRVNSGVETGLTGRQVAAVKGLNKLYKSIEADNNLQNKYPVKDIFEFIAHLTNDTFVKELQSKDRNFIQKVVDFISDILGLSDANELAKKYLKDIIHDGTFLEKEGITVVSSDYSANVKGAEGLTPKQKLLEAIKNNSKKTAETYHKSKSESIDSDFTKAIEKLLPKDQSLSTNTPSKKQSTKVEEQTKPIVNKEAKTVQPKLQKEKPIIEETEDYNDWMQTMQEYEKVAIEDALNDGSIEKAVLNGKISRERAIEIINSAELELPQFLQEQPKIKDVNLNKQIDLLSADFLDINKPDLTVSSQRIKIIDVPISSISTDTSSFQNRETEFSQESVDKILKAVQEDNFNWTEFDPVTLWKNDNNLFMLSGHSRLEAFKRLTTMGYAGFDTIPSEIFEGTKEDAIAIALRSNTLSTKETPIERAGYYRDARLKGVASRSILNEAKDYEGRNALTIIALSYLNPKGKAIADLKALGQEGDTKSKANSLQMARWVGEVRQQFPQVTDAHENEIYDWLKAGAYAKIKNLAEISSRINNVVSGFDFDAEKPLNLEHRATKSYVDETYEQQLSDKEKQIKEQQKLISDKATKYNEAQLTPQEVAEKLVPDNAILARMQQDYIKLKDKKGAISEANKGILSLFDNIQTEIDNGTITEQQAESFINTTDEIEESDPIIEDIERNAESEITASQAIEEGIELINGENVIKNREVKAEKKLAEKVSVLEKEKTARINEITKPELNMNTLLINDLFTMAATNEANRQEYEDIKSQFFSLKNLFDCLFA